MSIVNYHPQSAQVFMGLSTDTKPTNIAFGSKFIATDNGDVYLFTNAGAWLQVGTLGSATTQVVI